MKENHPLDFLTDWFNARWAPQMGSIDGHDVSFLAALFGQHEPRQIVEIGCASGLSTSVLAMLAQRNGSASIASFDTAHQFYGDRSKPLGYLLNEALPHPDVSVQLFPGCDSLDVAEKIKEPIDLCFIDALHKHPWPLVDTMVMLPLMKPGGIIVHHDLHMFLNKGHFATGPKVLHDRVPPKMQLNFRDLVDRNSHGRLLTRPFANNIYAFRVPQDIRSLAEKLSLGFCIGWDVNEQKVNWVHQDFALALRSIMKENYDPQVLQNFNVGYSRYRSLGSQQQVQTPPLQAEISLPRRAWRKLCRTIRA
ncbi:class I SAM-dependent methyltransferase [Ruegeria sp. 2012CJ41-6]|uniref:Class I SAM-dependent methyltransferase n=1 Tax=Ruegeria spongiae TaxID=2942209 RepID=A0ABT0Q1E3_9RHOB|nr:class I SAM-dependent methyltransferase [Ruegeria spongiae]MCL6283608.1 class I SAM-dependent methyltransferase [Ruegeria spongiae]